MLLFYLALYFDNKTFMHFGHILFFIHTHILVILEVANFSSKNELFVGHWGEIVALVFHFFESLPLRNLQF